MSEWWTYSLTSFLLFSARTYYRLFELYNADVWPLQIATLAVAATTCPLHHIVRVELITRIGRIAEPPTRRKFAASSLLARQGGATPLGGRQCGVIETMRMSA